MGEPTATFLKIVRDVIGRFRGELQNQPLPQPSSSPSKVAEIVEFSNAPKESHASQWVRLGDDATRNFQLELPCIELIIDQACETLCQRVIRICDHYFPAVREQQA